jgi:Cohesin domain
MVLSGDSGCFHNHFLFKKLMSYLFPIECTGFPVVKSIKIFMREYVLLILLYGIPVFLSGQKTTPSSLVTESMDSVNPPNQIATKSIFQGSIKTEDGKIIEKATIKIISACTPACTPSPVFTTATGTYEFCGCPNCFDYTITPALDTDPLNGVTTYDLVLISRHILGLEPLDNPYKMIAADANKSNAITTFDIVEIRKLILGIYANLPANTSWRFINKSQVFSQYNNPFADPIQENIKVSSTTHPPYNFVGVKTGDVNNTAVANQKTTDLPDLTLAWPNTTAKTEQTITIPVTYTGTEPLEAIQLGLQFDPSKLTLIGPSKGDLEGFSLDNFGLTQVSEGRIKAIWLTNFADPDQAVAPGAVLFYLTFKVKAQWPQDSELPLVLDNSVLENRVWRTDDTEYDLLKSSETISDRQLPEPSTQEVQVSISPNPTQGIFNMHITAQKAVSARIIVQGPFGQHIVVRNIQLAIGAQSIEIPELINQPAGVYTWKVWNKSFILQGHIMKG